jgi:hypothetical protein
MVMNLFRRSQSGSPFRTRAPARDEETDNEVVGQVASAIEKANAMLGAQRDGLRRRLDDVIARSAIVGGNDLDDCLTRGEGDLTLLAASDKEIERCEARLKELEEQLSHLEFLKAELQKRFPNRQAANSPDALPASWR